jgi:hypothetical protein
MSDELEASAEEHAPLTLSVKLGRTVNRGNYENDRYDIFIPVPYTPGQPLAPLLAQAFEEARAQIEKDSAYDERMRKLWGRYDYLRSEHTLEVLDELIARHAADETIQAHDRERLARRLGQLREERARLDEEKEREAKKQLMVIADTLAYARTYIESNPVPEPLWDENAKGEYIGNGYVQAPGWYIALHGAWWDHVTGYTSLPVALRHHLCRADISELLKATPEDVLAGGLLPYPSRPAEDAPSDDFPPDDLPDFDGEDDED